MLAGRAGRATMAVGINYSKWDALDVSDSEEEAEPDRASSRTALAQQHRELTEAAAAQQRLRQLINEHASGKPLEPPEEIRDILDEPLWCDEPGSVGGASAGAPHRADEQNDPGRAAGHGAAAHESSGQGSSNGIGTPSSKAVALAPASTGTLATTRRRGFADWDKLKLEDSDEEERAEKKESGETRPPAEVDKLRQLMQLQEGLSKMRTDREQRHKKIQQHEERILERDSRFGSSTAAENMD